MRDLAALAAILTMSGTAQAEAAGPRQSREVLMPTDPGARAMWEKWGFAEAVIDGDRVYLSGVVAFLDARETEPTAAFDRAFRQIEQILKRAGCDWDSVIDMTTYHVDLPAQMDAFVAVKQRYVKAPFPAWTAIDVDRLVPDRGLVEIKVVARRKQPVKRR